MKNYDLNIIKGSIKGKKFKGFKDALYLVKNSDNKNKSDLKNIQILDLTIGEKQYFIFPSSLEDDGLVLFINEMSENIDQFIGKVVFDIDFKLKDESNLELYKEYELIIKFLRGFIIFGFFLELSDDKYYNTELNLIKEKDLDFNKNYNNKYSLINLYKIKNI